MATARETVVVSDSDSDGGIEVHPPVAHTAAAAVATWVVEPTFASASASASGVEELTMLDRAIALKEAQAQALWAEVADLEARRRHVLAMREDVRASSHVQADWARTDFAWSPKVEQVRQRLLGERAFRFHQLEAINCTMAGRDSFVVMPTGGVLKYLFSVVNLLTTFDDY